MTASAVTRIRLDHFTAFDGIDLQFPMERTL